MLHTSAIKLVKTKSDKPKTFIIKMLYGRKGYIRKNNDVDYDYTNLVSLKVRSESFCNYFILESPSYHSYKSG